MPLLATLAHNPATSAAQRALATPRRPRPAAGSPLLAKRASAVIFALLAWLGAPDVALASAAAIAVPATAAAVAGKMAWNYEHPERRTAHNPHVDIPLTPEYWHPPMAPLYVLQAPTPTPEPPEGASMHGMTSAEIWLCLVGVLATLILLAALLA